jgi:hypothetical protein
MSSPARVLHSALLVMMLGDSIGLPFEGLAAPRINAPLRSAGHSARS